MNSEQHSLPASLGLCALNLAAPGLGFVAARDYRRGIPLFLLLNGCFALGLVFNGTILLPAFSPKSPDFNIVAMLTFVVQSFHAGGCGLLLLLEGTDNALSSLLVGDPGATYADLGSFHLLVAGALNYFSTVKLFDLSRNKPGAATELESGGETPGGQADEEGGRR